MPGFDYVQQQTVFDTNQWSLKKWAPKWDSPQGQESNNLNSQRSKKFEFRFSKDAFIASDDLNRTEKIIFVQGGKKLGSIF